MLVCEDGTRNRVGRAHEGFVYCVLDLGYPFYTLGCVHTTHMNIHCSGAYLLKSIPQVTSMKTKLGLKWKYKQ